MKTARHARRRIDVVVAIVFLAVSVASSPFLLSVRGLFSIPMSSYRVLRTEYGFGGIPMDQITARLNAILPPGAPVAFGSAILSRVFEEQRFTEALYPRLVDQVSSQRIDIVQADRPPALGERELGRYRSGASVVRVVLTGPHVAPPVVPASVLPLDFVWRTFLAACLGVVGIGLAFETLLPPSEAMGSGLAIAASVILCALAFAILATASTILQSAAPWRAIAVLGSFALVAVLLAAERRGRRVSRAVNELARALRVAENWLMIVVLAVFAAKVAHVPIVGWDARSDWFFRAKQVFEHGYITRSDAVQPFLEISQQEYPLLFPAWASFFTSLSTLYNERMASMAIPVLLAALVAAVWILARGRAGRWIGASFALIAFFSVERLSATGYMDGLLALLLIVAALGFESGNLDALGWTACGAASLLKLEGLVLGVSTAAICALLAPGMRGKRFRRRFLPFAVFLPSCLFLLCAAHVGAWGDTAPPDWQSVWNELPRRTAVLLRYVGNLLGNGELNALVRGRLTAEGTVALAVAVVVVVILRGRSSSTGRLLLALGLSYLAFDFAALISTPRGIEWHAATVIARLLLLPSLFFVLAAFLFLRDWAALGLELENSPEGSLPE